MTHNEEINQNQFITNTMLELADDFKTVIKTVLFIQ